MYNIIIVGAGTAGMTAALYCARAGKKVLLLEKETIGGQISSSPCVENYPGIASISGSEFSDNLFEQVSALGVEFEFDTVTAVNKNSDGYEVVTENNSYSCQKLIIATGVKHRTLGVEGEQNYQGKGISYCAVCDGAFYEGKTVVVVGGGSAALQSALYLSEICKEVYIIHRREGFRAEQSTVDKVKSTANIKLVLNGVVAGFEGENELCALKLFNVADKSVSKLDINGLFVSVGQIPQNEVFKNLVKLDDAGFIVAGEDCLTTSEDVYVAGDCRTKVVRQLTTAAADGATAALAACR